MHGNKKSTMASQSLITFVVPTYGADDVLINNLLASPCLRTGHQHEVLVQRGYSSAAVAYNEALDRAKNDIVVFAHQDVIFPEAWMSQLDKTLENLHVTDPNWGVLGCWGATRDGQARGCVYAPGPGLLGNPFGSPRIVQTLDEIVLILRRSSGLRFDQNLPHFHFYGTDICLRAAEMGKRNYAIPAFCVHNTNHYLVLPKEFYECYHYIRRAWNAELPIQTTCIRITKLGIPMYRRRLNEIILKYAAKKAFLSPRKRDVDELVRQSELAWSDPSTAKCLTRNSLK